MRIVITLLFVTLLVFGCSGSKGGGVSFEGLNTAEILKVMNICQPPGGERLDESIMGNASDSYAGIGKKIDKVVSKDMYVVYAGLENQLNLKATKPLAVVVCHGNTNIFTVSKVKPFEGNVVFITHQGYQNQYSGAPVITFDEFRKKVGN